MGNLEGKTLKELYAIRDERKAQRFEEYQIALDKWSKLNDRLRRAQISPPNDPNHLQSHIWIDKTQSFYDEFYESWHEDDADIYTAVKKLRRQESDAQDIRNIQEILGKSPNRNKANEPKIPLVVWVGIVLLIAFIATKMF